MPRSERILQVPGAAILALLALLLAPACGERTESSSTQPLLVSAASDLVPAFREIGARYEDATGTRVVFNFGSSGLLAQQIEAGAGVDVFASASLRYVEELEERSLLLPSTRAVFARGRLALRTRSGLVPPAALAGLTDPAIRTIAIASPAHAPYGVAAREALIAAGLWDELHPKIVYGEDVRQAYQYVETGNADVAVVAYTLCMDSPGNCAVVPADLHAPLDQALAVVADSERPEQARAFVDFVTSAEGKTILRRRGFLIPEQ
ncbi:MAG TPA: molybdate ABC transporter substrate-binding protein [Thermoanaerobaculia bacterium]|nr:molybdate ABC transporter substrate-binding protein [Thermoanaerobaculia bacterium]